MAVDTEIGLHRSRNKLLLINQKRSSTNTNAKRAIYTVGFYDVFIWINKQRKAQFILGAESLMAFSALRTDTGYMQAMATQITVHITYATGLFGSSWGEICGIEIENQRAHADKVY